MDADRALMAGNAQRDGRHARPRDGEAGARRAATAGSGGKTTKRSLARAPAPKAPRPAEARAGPPQGRRAKAKAASARRHGAADRAAAAARRRRQPHGDPELVAGRNPVVEALRAQHPGRRRSTSRSGAERDDRIREAFAAAPATAGCRCSRSAGPSSTGWPHGALHQGIGAAGAAVRVRAPRRPARPPRPRARRRCSSRWTASPTRATSAPSSARLPRSARTGCVVPSAAPPG